MTLEQYSSLAEMIAAFATVVALIYLAVQVRAATASMKAESRRSEQQVPYITSIVENPDVAKIFTSGLADDPALTPEDSVRFAFLMGQLLGSEAAYFDEVRFGVGSSERLMDRQTDLMRFLSTPGGRRFWKHYGHSFPKEFRSYIQEKLDDSETT